MPVGPFPDFDTCVRAMRGKVDDPEAYCGSLESASLSPVSHMALIIPEGIDSDDGRSFPVGKLTWRDPIPLQFTDETTTDHEGARHVGNVSNIGRWMIDGELWLVGEVTYDTDELGMEAQRLADEEKLAGISADVAINILDVDQIGDPIDYEATLVGVTQTPMQAFAGARIYSRAVFDNLVTGTFILASAAVDYSDLFMLEPDDDDPRYILQPHGEFAIPLTIEGRRFYGHAGVHGQCHTGFVGKCIGPPESATGYALFHTNTTTTDRGEVATGTVCWRGDHAPITVDAAGARDHYAHHAYAWGDARVVNGRHGPWVSGVVREHVTDDELEILRRSTWSGDWRRGELVGLLTVNQSAFPIARIAASAEGGEVMALVASGMVTTGANSTDDPEPEPVDLAGLLQSLHEKVDRLLPISEEEEAEVVELTGKIARLLGQ